MNLFKIFVQLSFYQKNIIFIILKATFLRIITELVNLRRYTYFYKLKTK